MSGLDWRSRGACLNVSPETMFPEDERPQLPVPVRRAPAAHGDNILGRIGDALDAIDGRAPAAAGVQWVPNPAVEEAKAVCRGCDVRETCLAWALEHRQDHGIWGGMTGRERRAMKRQHYRTLVQDETLFEVSA